ncbi:MAG: hypothetical protein EBZ59_07180 [Planctomycetia bacterium]|nr:hypothetical protein [Planctomycetia bacterium]
MHIRPLVIAAMLAAVVLCLPGCSLFTDPEAEKVKVREEAAAAIKTAQDQAKADAKAEADKAALAVREEAAKIEAEKARVAVENKAAQRDANRRIAALKNATDEQLAAIADELEQLGESKAQALEAYVRARQLQLDTLNQEADRRVESILAAGKAKADAIDQAARSRIDKIDQDAAVLGGIAQVVPQLAGVASAAFPGAGSLVIGGVAGLIGAVLGHGRGKASGQTQVNQIVSAASRVIDSIDVLKSKDPIVAKAFEDHKETLAEWQGLAGKQLVDDLQRGVTPRMDGVNT